MARIQAGSTLVNQYAPPFVVSDSVAQGWRLQWNETLQAFEAVDPDANTVFAGFDSIEVYIVENANQQTFVAPFATDSKASVLITIDGVKQQQDAYAWSSDTDSNTTTVTLSDQVNNETVEILGLLSTGGATVEVYGPVNIDSVVAGTVNSSYDISWFAPSTESLIVTVDGVKQSSNVYNVQPVPGSNFTATRVTFPDRTVTFSTSSTGVTSGTDVITTDTAHGFTTGDGVYYSQDGGSQDIGLVNNTLYYVREGSTAFRLTLHPTRQDALDDTNALDLTSGGAETHALTLIADPFLYIETAVINAGGSGYAVNDVITLAGGTFISPAQFTVTETDVDAVVTYTTTAGVVDGVTLVSGGSGYPVSGSGTFTITLNTDPGYVAGSFAIIDWTTDGTGAIDSVVINDGGSGYAAASGTVSIDDLPAQTLGAISAVNFDFFGEYVVFPGSPASATGGSGTGATFDITKAAPRIEIIGITTTGGTPASPVDATNLGAPDDENRFGLYDSKSVTGDVQVLNFRSIAEGTNVTMAVAGNSIQISAANPTFAETATGGGTSLFDTFDQDAPVFRKVIAGDNIALSVAGADNPIEIAQNFNYVSSASATINVTTERLINVLAAGATAVNLPAASTLTAGDSITVKDANGTAATNNISVTPNGTDQIDGVNAAVVLNSARAYLTLYSDGANWHIIAQG